MELTQAEFNDNVGLQGLVFFFSLSLSLLLLLLKYVSFYMHRCLPKQNLGKTNMWLFSFFFSLSGTILPARIMAESVRVLCLPAFLNQS